jgi:hypothetical protein
MCLPCISVGSSSLKNGIESLRTPKSKVLYPSTCSGCSILFVVVLPVHACMCLDHISSIWAPSILFAVIKYSLTIPRILCVALLLVGISFQSLALKVGGLFFGTPNWCFWAASSSALRAGAQGIEAREWMCCSTPDTWSSRAKYV